MQRQERLRKGAEFDTVYSKGTVVGGPLVVVRHCGGGSGSTRWGFAVGKRLAKQAARRNRTKRRLKAAAQTFALSRPADIVVTARNGAIEAPYSDLRIALGRALRRAGLLAGEATA
ncbi:MAG: ribonuclease P protein component [Tepidiformaceae bacterium]